MKILITGTSGSGKSTVGRELIKRGYSAIETDIETYNGTSIACWRNKVTGEWVDMPWPPPQNWFKENDWTWRTSLLLEKLHALPGTLCFACGDARNKDELYPLIDRVFFLQADDETLHHRIQTRSDNYFGKSPSQFKWVTQQNQSIEDEAAKAKGIIIDSSQPIDKIADQILNQLS